MRKRWRVFLLTVLLCGAIPGCHPTGVWFSFGPRPAELAGVWIDSANTPPSDTAAWLLAPDGDKRTLHIIVDRDNSGNSVIRQTESSPTRWYLSGALTDTAHPAICFKRRARDSGTCVAFRLDTVTSGADARRRLTILGNPGENRTHPQILIERHP